MTTPSPGTVVKAWVDAFNDQDVDKLASLYAREAINHQVAESEVLGRDAIRQMFGNEFAAAEMVCLAENIFQDGDWATLEW